MREFALRRRVRAFESPRGHHAAALVDEACWVPAGSRKIDDLASGAALSVGARRPGGVPGPTVG